MKSVVQVVTFQLVWLAAVLGAARGLTWLGPLALVPYLALHLGLVAAADRRREIGFALAVGALGTLADSGLHAAAVTRYPAADAAWPWPVVPPFITALWIALATLPRFSLSWLSERPALAVLIGAAAGTSSYAAGARLGAVAVGPSPALTWSALALEYALLVPLLLRLSPTPTRG